MQFIRNLSITALALACTTQLYAQALDIYHLKPLLYIIYLTGLFFPLLLNLKAITFHKVDILVISFSIFFLGSIIYTINNHYTTEFILFAILPLSYYNGKILIQTDKLKLFFINFISTILLVNIYIFIKLFENHFNYHAYYHYSDAYLLVDYLTLSLFNVVAIIFLMEMKSLNNYIKIVFVFFLTIMVLISGARFSIIFLLFFLFLSFIKLPFKTISLIALNGSLVFILLLNNNNIYEKVESYFGYSISRLDGFTGNDKSVEGREIAIDEALLEINKSPFFGYGLNSSENLLSLKYVHNMVLETFLETGIFNTLILLSLLSVVIFMSGTLYKNNIIYRGLFFTDLYLILAHLKSFTIAEGKLLFFFFGIVVSVYFHHRILITSKSKKASNETNSDYF